MNMKTVLLTTETSHHVYFAQKVAESFPWEAIFLETQVPAKPPFETSHPFEGERDRYEQQTLLKGKPLRFQDVAKTRAFESVNAGESVTALRSIAPEVVIVFGTGKLAPAVLKASANCWNLHGGNPEHFRGLDTHLWAIYHRDFANLITTLHVVDDQFDTGDILLQDKIPLARSSKLYQLRASNTEICVMLVLKSLTIKAEEGGVPRRAQTNVGRYYSYMPAVLKAGCLAKFDQYVSQLR